MKILIDTTISKKATVSLYNDKQLISGKSGDSALELVDQFIKENKLTLSGLEFELKNEPGSYTGLKVGASLVNALNFVNGKKALITPKY